MELPELHIAEDLHGCCPDFCVGWLMFTAVPLSSSKAVDNALVQTFSVLRTKLESVPLAEMPNIGESRRGYKACGKDPGRWRVSSEALYRRVRQGKELYRINTVVDVNNLISLETGFSLGSYDREKIGTVLHLRRGFPGESYAGIGKDAVDLSFMPLLADTDGPVGSPTSDATRAMIRPESRNILTLIYSFSARSALEQALVLARQRFMKLAGADIQGYGIVE